MDKRNFAFDKMNFILLGIQEKLNTAKLYF